MEKQLNRKEIYSGKVIHVVVDEVEIDDGSVAKREVVLHHGGACVALKDKDGKFFTVTQYRYSIGRDMLEFCAGKIEKDEDPSLAVIREAEEELGYTVKNLRSFGSIIPTCGYDSERIWLYYGEADEAVGQHLDKDERIKVETYSFDELKQMVKEGKIADAKTIILLYRLEMEGLNG